MDKQNKKAIQSKDDLDDLIKSIKAEDINSGQIEESTEIDFLQKELAFYQSLTQQQQKLIEKLLDTIGGNKEQHVMSQKMVQEELGMPIPTYHYFPFGYKGVKPDE